MERLMEHKFAREILGDDLYENVKSFVGDSYAVQHTGGGCFVVYFHHPLDGIFIVSDEYISYYKNEDDFWEQNKKEIAGTWLEYGMKSELEPFFVECGYAPQVESWTKPKGQ